MPISKKSLISLLAGALILSCRMGFTQEPKMIPMKDFFRNPATTNYQISPDGRYVSFTKSYKNRLNIFLRPRGAGKAKRLTSVTDRDIFSYTWKGNDYLVYVKDNDGNENFHLFAVRRQGGQARDLTPFPGVRAEIIDELPDNDKEMIIGLNKRDREVFDVFRLDVASGELTLITQNSGDITAWVTDHQGKVRAAVSTDGLNNSLLYRENESEAFMKILTLDFRDTLQPLFFTFDNRQLYCLSNVGRDKLAAVVFNPQEGEETQMIYENPQVDVSGLSYSRKRKVLTAAHFTTWKMQRKILDNRTQEMFDFLSRRLPDTQIFITDYNRDEDVFIVFTADDRSAGTYYLYEMHPEGLHELARSRPWLKKEELAQVKPIEYTSRDGLAIHGYLTLPVRSGEKKLAAVINPHGGPWARDVWAYDPEVQFLANRGYAVLQMNFRGSTGYGKKFWEAGFRQWGRKMQDDITDGVNWLLGQGKVDAAAVAIYGGSYGGYAALAGLAFTPKLYACGIDYCGVSNLFTLLKSIPAYWKPQLEQWYVMVGNPRTDKKLFEEISPVFHAGAIRVPLLVAQGAQDPRVNIDESNQIVAALRKRGIPVTYIVKQNEGHGFRNQENRFDFYRAMERFLAEYIGD